ncbi:MAG: glycosyltransferase family 9 protein [Planctomycetota bacterium]
MDNSTKVLPDPPQRVLAIRLSAMGDVLHCLPALEALQELWPETTIDWVTESLSSPLLEGHPRLGRVVKLSRKVWRKQLRNPLNLPRVVGEAWGFIRELRQERYDLIVDFQSNMRSVLVAALARYRRRICHHRTEVKDGNQMFRAIRPARPSGLVHRVEKNLHLVRHLGWSGQRPDPQTPTYADEAADLPPLPADAIYLHPFVSAYGRFKEWPEQHYSDLARRLAADGHAVVVMWAPEDLAAAERIVAGAADCAVLAPPTPSLRHVAAMLTQAKLLVAADTGILHLGTALNRPVVALYGPKDPQRYGPWTPQSRTLRGDVACAPCTLRTCEHAICMQVITPASVERAIQELIPATS